MTLLLAEPHGTEIAERFDFTCTSGRPDGAFVSRLARVMPGLRTTLSQTAPYAQWWVENNRRSLASGRPLWVVLGDSLSQGIGATSPDRGWVGRIAADPPARLRDAAVLNLSFKGARILEVLRRQVPVLENLRTRHDIALVSVVTGNNDLMSPRLAPFLEASAQLLVDALPHGTVIARQPGMQRSASAFNQVLARAADRGIVPADFRIPHLRDFLGRLAQDRFHPNDLGYAQMAAVARTAL
ncbi:MAG: SGNH/GDSL hydrolase family protein [Aeromicrobium sp.]|uniref:SGNH/GDSL hydrolase family protein n=1 Tax=Aeromicrobium sp. TaxID=1871063 RepID=UPI003C4CAD5C